LLTGIASFDKPLEEIAREINSLNRQPDETANRQETTVCRELNNRYQNRFRDYNFVFNRNIGSFKHWSVYQCKFSLLPFVDRHPITHANNAEDFWQMAWIKRARR